MVKRLTRDLREALNKELAKAWDDGYHEGSEDNREEYGRKVRWGRAKNPYKSGDET